MDNELKVSRFLRKISNKKFFSRDNFKLSEFVLSTFYLRLFEITPSFIRGKEKLKINLSSIRFVEKVLDAEFNRPNIFQICFQEELINNKVLIYVVANNEKERDEWIVELWKATKDLGAKFFSRYHPGTWQKFGRYSCCSSIDRRDQGCTATFNSILNFNSFQQTSANKGCLSTDLNLQNKFRALNLEVGLLNGVGSQHSQISSDSNSDQIIGHSNSMERVIAVHNYNPIRDNQLALVKGDEYFVIDSSSPQWWYVSNMAGMAGYVPTNYVQKPDGLKNFDWYYKDLTRQHAEAILLEENREGCFIVRDSMTKRDTYTLSVTSKETDNSTKLRVHHYHINFRRRATNLPTNESESPIFEYYLSEKHAFSTIPELIFYHKHNSGGLIVRLRSPPIRDRDRPATAGMGMDDFELDPSELFLEKEPIGTGQFGVVKKGTFHGIQVAVKLMLDGAMNEEDFVEEAKNMKKLNHPNLVQLFGVVLKSRPIMIITEFMEFGSLRDYLLKNDQRLSQQAIILADMCAQVAKGMAYLEANQFVHRDLAARNCLVKSVHKSNFVCVKVADFGMTRFLLDNVYEPSAGAKFPVRWAPPEVFQSIFTSKADIWSFAVLMWEVFTCCREIPYQGQQNNQVFQYIVGGGRLSKPAICPQNLYVLMIECWQHEVTKRPTFAYILQKLNTFLEQNSADQII